MPCTITGSLEGDRALALSESNESLEKKLREVTQVACELANYLKRFDDGKLLTPATKRWIRRHRSIDLKVGK